MRYEIKMIAISATGPRLSFIALAPNMASAKELIEFKFGPIIVMEEDIDHPDHFDLFTELGEVLSISPYRERTPPVPRAI